MGWDSGDETTQFEGKIEHTTAKAYLLEPTMGQNQVWCPKSVVVEMSQPDEYGNRMFTVHQWWAKKNGM